HESYLHGVHPLGVCCFDKHRPLGWDRIRCWTPAEFTEAYEDYVHNYCWIKNTYYIPQHDYIPEDISLHQEAEITYYQWVPIILLLQVLLFKLPNVFWEILHGGSGIQIGNIIKYAEWSHYKSRDDRRDLIDNLSCTLDKWLDTEQQYEHNCFVRFRSKLSHIFFFFCNKREGTYLTALYICIKGLYLGNIIGQFFMLSAFMATDYNNYGFHWLHMMQSGEDMKVNPRFPKVTLCDFKIRQLQNIKDFTVQCVLPINLFNEMIFIIIWFWLFLMGVISAYSIIKWLYLIVLKRNNYMYVKKYLKLSGRIGPEDKQLCRQFADNYLRDDGCFVARMIAINTTDLVTADLLDCMFDKYRQKVKRAKKSETSLSETTDDGSFMEKENYEH
ncbi:innexin unc-9-like, partial [Ruditapes philippinarum]|uniref:innexin unc-9-like n=1 Tax=Ruditapes philippinarum TaxID=129788 RepID=UPI00295BE357